MYVIKEDGAGNMEHARNLEKEGDLERAALLYEKLLKSSRQKLKIIHRLLIIFRKLKNTTKELFYIDMAIKIHEEQNAIKKTTDKKIGALSTQLNKMLGHVDKKGRSVFVPPEMAKLLVRKERLLKKAQPQKNRK